MEFVDEIRIAKPPELAWERLANIEAMPDYLPQVEEARWLQPGPPRIGSKLVLRARLAGRAFTLHLRLAEEDRPRLWVLDSEGHGRLDVSGRLAMRLIPEGGGTRLRRTLTLGFGSPMAALAARPLVPMFLTRELRDDSLAALKAFVEGPPAGGAGS